MTVTVTGDRYTREPPSVPATLDLFAGEWSSRLPGALGHLGPGAVPLFEDNRIEWLIEQIGGVAGMDVLELGPLECGHAYMLEQAGAASVLSIESNSHAYLKCLVVKELLAMTRTRVLFGDFMPWFAQNTARYDLAVASGVLYHMVDPIGMLARLTESSDRVFLWTHYYDADVLHANPQLAPKFRSSTPAERDGFAYTLHRQDYLAALEHAGFCGGSEPFSYWLSRADIVRFLEHAGFTDVRIAHETRDHQHGPCLSVLAQRAAPGAAPRPAPLTEPVTLTAADAEAAVAHYRGQVVELTTRVAALQATLDAVTGSRLWRTRQRAGGLARRARSLARRR